MNSANGKEIPIACLLDAADLAGRHADLAALGRRSLLSVQGGGGSPSVLRFRGDPETRAELERIVAAEAGCCGFLDMDLEGRDPITLRIDAPPDAAPVVEELVGAFASEAEI